MGVSLIPGLFLVRHKANIGDARRGLILGRQKLHLNGRKMTRFISEAAKPGCVLEPKDFVQEGDISVRPSHDPACGAKDDNCAPTGVANSKPLCEHSMTTENEFKDAVPPAGGRTDAHLQEAP